MHVKRTSILEPAVAPSMFADHLRIEQVGPMEQSYVDAAVEMLERETNTTLPLSTFRLFLDRFPGGSAPIRLPRPPLVSVTRIEWDQDDDNLAVLMPGDWTTDPYSTPGTVVPADGAAWPDLTPRPGRVRIEFTAGHPSDELPTTLRQGALLLAAHNYENREATTPLRLSETPLAVQRIVNLHVLKEAI
jgi:uncharacterized phiE125 gp8 family phage protein